MALNKDDLFRMYVTERKSIPMISKEVTKPISVVRYWLVKYGIPLRSRVEGIKDSFKYGRRKPRKKNGRKVSEETREKMRNARLLWGEKNAAGISIKPNGYAEYTRGKNKGRTVHVVLMEEKIGRKLMPNEVVHHINKNRADNRIENLQLMTRREHSRLHAQER